MQSAISQLLTTKSGANLRPQYITSLRQYLAQFARGREELAVCNVTPELVEAWFAQRRESASARASNLGRLSALFQFAWRRGWISENPCKRVERVRIDHPIPAVLTPEQSAVLLDRCSRFVPGLIPYVTLCLFCGLRPAEARRICWEDIDLDRNVVTLGAAVSKVRRRRLVPVNEAAKAWLSSHVRKGSVYVGSHSSWRRDFRRLIDFAEIDWTQDVLRHTAASYLLAEHNDAAKVALWLGTSHRMLMTHYRELVRPDDAAKFWSLRPK